MFNTYIFPLHKDIILSNLSNICDITDIKINYEYDPHIWLFKRNQLSYNVLINMSTTYKNKGADYNIKFKILNPENITNNKNDVITVIHHYVDINIAMDEMDYLINPCIENTLLPILCNEWVDNCRIYLELILDGKNGG